MSLKNKEGGLLLAVEDDLSNSEVWPSQHCCNEACHQPVESPINFLHKSEKVFDRLAWSTKYSTSHIINNFRYTCMVPSRSLGTFILNFNKS